MDPNGDYHGQNYQTLFLENTCITSVTTTIFMVENTWIVITSGRSRMKILSILTSLCSFVVMHCPTPPKVIHGKHVGEDFTYGKSVIYICDAGYSCIGNHSVTCIWNSSNSVKWSEAPRCQGPFLFVFCRSVVQSSLLPFTGIGVACQGWALETRWGSVL